MLGKIPFPISLALALLLPPVAWAYLRLGAPSGRRPTALAHALRAALVALLVGLPLATSGPGPAQLTLGLLSGYLGIRLVALGAAAARGRGDAGAVGGAGGVTLLGATLAAMSVRDLLEPAPPDPARRGRRALALGLAGVAACLTLLWAGNQARLWRVSPFADDMLVYLEVAAGSAGVNNLIIALAAAGGQSVAGLQLRPALSASLSEFWAARWNRLVGRNLDRGFFRPLCRRGYPRAGVAAAFVASGVMHVIPVLAAAPWRVAARPAAVVMGFFLLHGALVMAERALGWHRAPAGGAALARARLRTLVVFAALSPLMLGPFAEICGVHGRGLGN